MAVVQAAYGGADVNLTPSGNRIYYVDNGGSPTAGTYNVGDLALIVPVSGGVAPTTAAPLGYRCITAGTPGTWVPLGASVSSAGTTAVASTTTIVATAKVFHVSGTTAIQTITTTGLQAGDSITLIPDGVFTWGTSGNISIGGTAVVDKALIMVWDGTKLNPSYLS